MPCWGTHPRKESTSQDIQGWTRPPDHTTISSRNQLASIPAATEIGIIMDKVPTRAPLLARSPKKAFYGRMIMSSLFLSFASSSASSLSRSAPSAMSLSASSPPDSSEG